MLSDKTIAIIFLTLVTIVIIWLNREDFATNRDKASSIVDWFNTNQNHTYKQYRSDLSSKSNIVEYEDAKRLFQDSNLTVDTMRDKLKRE